MAEETHPEFPGLQGQHFIVLNTFRKSGVAVPTPVWFVQRDSKLYIWTGSTSGKVKRLRNNPRLTLAPSTAQGKPLNPPVSGLGRLAPDNESKALFEAFNKKYGVQMRIFRWLNRKSASVFIEITPDDAGQST